MGQGEESHREHAERKSCRMLRPIKHLGQSGVDMMHDILKIVWEDEQMPEECKKSEIAPIYK